MRLVPALAWALLAALVLTAAGPRPAAAAERFTGRVLVSVAPEQGPPRTLARAARPTGAGVPEVGLRVVRPVPGTTPRGLAHRLRDDPGVRDVALERRHAPRLLPDDPALTRPDPARPDVPLQWWAAALGLPEAWDLSRGARSLVAVVDTGVEAGHPELAGKLRGLVDADPTPGAPGPGGDEAGHGTHVASVACAAGDNGRGLAGAGLDCGLLAIRTDFTDASVVRSIVAAADRGADVLVMSFGTDAGTPAPRPIVDALRYAAARDVVLVAAAADRPIEDQGDPANVLQPTGTGPDLDAGLGLSVTAAGADGTRSWFAGRGSQISLAAYGSFAPPRQGGPRGLLGAYPAAATPFELGGLGTAPCRCRTLLDGDARYAYLQGTSMAAPQVAGVAALVRDLNPDLSAREVIRLMKRTARGRTWTPELGWGIVDAGAALRAASAVDRRAPVSRAAFAGWAGRDRVVLRLTAADRGPRRVRVSGIARIDILRRTAGGGAVRVARTGRAGRVTVRLPRGVRRSALFTRAVDRAGNREAAPRRADVRVARR